MPMLEYFYHVTADSLEHGGGSGTEMGACLLLPTSLLFSLLTSVRHLCYRLCGNRLADSYRAFLPVLCPSPPTLCMT